MIEPPDELFAEPGSYREGVELGVEWAEKEFNRVLDLLVADKNKWYADTRVHRYAVHDIRNELNGIGRLS